MLEPRIQQHFFESADWQYQAAETLSKPIADAAQWIVEGLTSGSRLLCAGLGFASTDARYVAALLSGRFENERPGLAALWLDARGSHDGLLPSAATPAGPGERLARLIATHGHPGDVLLLFDAPGGAPAAWPALLAAAQGQELSVIAVTGGPARDWATQLSDTDALLRLPPTRPARVAEGYRLVAHALCDAIDLQLLGSEH